MDILTLLVALLVISWLGGFAFHVGGDLIHILLVVAAVVLLVRFIRGSSVV